jgi:chemotaxis protein methyltransferase CheR
MPEITDNEFAQFQRFIYGAAGISLPNTKKALVSGRLAKRLAACKVSSYGDYFRLLSTGRQPMEMQTAVDLLTTNETYFFREPKHFAFLRRQVTAARKPGTSFRVWSAAGSTGEEAYSIAMMLEDCIPGQWDVMASDISTRVLERARVGHYSMERISHFPAGYLQRFCLKGRGSQEGTLLIEKHLREKVSFQQINLNGPLPKVGLFDVVFLRNVLIYFNTETKRAVVARILNTLRPGGFLLIGHSESLAEVSTAVEVIAPAIYRKLP